MGSLWAVVFTAYFVATLYRYSGNDLPGNIEKLRMLFEGGLTSFLSSWAFPIVFIVGWFVVSYQLGKNSGWQKLAVQYTEKSNAPSAEKYRLGNGCIGKVPYGNSLKVSATRSGLLIRVLFPFRFGSPNLYIPWSEIDQLTIKPTTCEAGITGFISKASTAFSRNMYAHISLLRYPDQKIAIPWDDSMELFVPESMKLKKD